MKLPNGQLAVVDIAKLSDYCLSATHLRGRHKARVFAATLSMDETAAAKLREVLLLAAKTEEAQISSSDEHGTRYIIDFVIRHKDKSASARSIWIIRNDEEIPRTYRSMVSYGARLALSWKSCPPLQLKLNSAMIKA